MTKVKMLKDTKACPDGVHPQDYLSGQEYEVSEEILNNFIADGLVEMVDDKPKQKPAPEENKAVIPHENKKGKGRKNAN